MDIYGERLQQRHVQVDPAKLAENGVSLEQVMETSANAVDAGVLQYTESFAPGTGGFVEAGGQRMNVRHVQPIVGPEQLAKVPVVNSERPGAAAGRHRHGARGPPAGLGRGRRQRRPRPDADRPEVPRGQHAWRSREGVEEAIAELRPGLPGIEIDTTIFRPATFIEQSIDNLTRRC